MKLRAPGPKPIRVAAVNPNEGVKADYRKRLLALIEAMHKDVMREVLRAYKATPPHALLAKDASPAVANRAVMKALSRKWGKTFADAAEKIAAHFADQVLKHNDFALKTTLRKAGFSVKFQMTRPANDAYRAVIGENVGLIKSIPSQHLADVEGMVMRSVQHGRALGDLSKDLQGRFGVTKRRAALIARDQNNKATAIMNKIRKLDLGIKKSRWIHTAASKHPRESHEDMNGTLFDTAEGCFDKEYGDFVQPGELINCGCIAEGIIPGMDDDQEGDDEAA
jgi:uncharacterized protein with gpF-like domain